jgi:hypothetical protein
MEHIMHSNIIKHLEKNNIPSEYQHGFRKERSCDTLRDLTNGPKSGDQLDCILDFSKAFDKVSQKRFIYKCQFYGIRGNALQWITTHTAGSAGGGGQRYH